MKKYFELAIILFLSSLNYGATASFESKIAIVDIQSVLDNSIAIADIKKSIGILGTELTKDINIKENELKKSEEELLKKKTYMSEDAFEKEANIFNQKVGEAQKEIQHRKNKIYNVEHKAIGKVDEATKDIITQLVKKYNIEVVLFSSQVLFAAERLNITSEVIALLNNKLKTVKLNIE